MITLQDLQNADRARPAQLMARKVKFSGNGLSTEEIDKAEEIVGAPFPEDFILFLSHLEDPNGIFFDWKNVTQSTYADRIKWVLDGVVFDLENNSFWDSSLGEKPEAIPDQITTVKAAFSTWPKLAPIFEHRFLPIEPLRSGNPVLSIWQTDIINYGENLLDYLYREFNLDSRFQPDASTAPAPSIPIWYEI